MIKDYEEIKRLIAIEGNYHEGEYKGVKWIAFRHSTDRIFHWCGYIELQLGLNPFLEKLEYSGDLSLPFHFGATYLDKRKPTQNKEWEKTENYWTGFDCAHCDDISMVSDYPYSNATYKTLDFVKNNIFEVIDAGLPKPEDFEVKYYTVKERTPDE